MRALLDINVLIALLDANHLHHRSATGWMEVNAASGWASCPLTQNGCIRIMSQPSYPNAVPASAIAERLHEAAALPLHQFWEDDISMLTPGLIDWNHILGSRQVTDAYLLALAVKYKGRLVTLDKGISLHAVLGATNSALEVIV